MEHNLELNNEIPPTTETTTSYDTDIIIHHASGEETITKYEEKELIKNTTKDIYYPNDTFKNNPNLS